MTFTTDAFVEDKKEAEVPKSCFANLKKEKAAKEVNFDITETELVNSRKNDDASHILKL